MTTARLTPADLRSKAIALMRECCLPILTALLLACLPTIIANLILYLSPSAPATLESSITQTGGQTTWGALITSICVELLGTLLLSPILVLGLQKGLLAHARGEKCTLRCICDGLPRWKTAIALEFLIGLRMLGYLFLGSIAAFLLSFIPILGAIAAIIGLLVLSWWVTMRYALARCHLADDAEEICTASSCLDYSVADAKSFSIIGLIEVIWPGLLIEFISSLLSEFLAASLGLSILTAALNVLASAVYITGFTVIYLYLHDTFVAEGEETNDPGLARARALAAGEEYAEDTAQSS